jgi:hypothetical protein
MQILATDNFWRDDGSDSVSDAIKAILEQPFEGIEIEEVNAGLGADWPAIVWRSLQGATVTLTILSAPATIEENWPKWKEVFDSLIDKVTIIHQTFYIDHESAQLISLKHASTFSRLRHDFIRIDFAFRHYSQNAEGLIDELVQKESDVIDNTVSGNMEAARQVNCRYLFGISDCRQSLTIIVERDGTVSYCARL